MVVCPKCGFKESNETFECPKCGLIYSKYRDQNTRKPEVAQPRPPDKKIQENRGPQYDSFMANLLFSLNPKADRVDFILRSVLFAVFFIWGWCFIFSSVNDQPFGSGFWHMINLPFHEAGHIFFRPFGRLVTSMGGTLAQLLLPCICMGVFLVKTRDTFAASFCVWWLGQNFMDIAPYIDDARRLTMPLVGGNTGQTSPYGFHDWEYVLTETKLLRHDHMIASLSHGLGTCLILLAFAWWAYLLFGYYKQLET
ncbi:MAG: zinc ribbon domain-containing protein [Proteobacteria bacterium]|nr:zinc ribbon domain-containing protein [Pseudomonadota bacterium]